MGDGEESAAFLQRAGAPHLHEAFQVAPAASTDHPGVRRYPRYSDMHTHIYLVQNEKMKSTLGRRQLAVPAATLDAH